MHHSPDDPGILDLPASPTPHADLLAAVEWQAQALETLATTLIEILDIVPPLKENLERIRAMIPPEP